MNLEWAALPDPVTILGQHLEPYSLGHELLLRRHNSPFVTDALFKAEQFEEELFMGVYLCALKWAEACQMVNRLAWDGDTRLQLLEWKGNCQRDKAYNAGEKALQFRDYIVAGSTCPKFVLNRKGRGRARKPGSSWLAILLNTLTGHLGWTFTEAINCPYGWAQHQFVAYWEKEGAVRVPTPDEIDEMDAVRAYAKEQGMELIKYSDLMPEQGRHPFHQSHPEADK